MPTPDGTSSAGHFNDDMPPPPATTTTTTTFDYIIVGGGTSAMGILHGLLSSSSSVSSSSKIKDGDVLTSNAPSKKDDTTMNDRPPPQQPIRIAVLERGDLISLSSSSSVSVSVSESNASSTQSLTDSCLRPLHRWCAASFPTYLNHPWMTTTTNSCNHHNVGAATSTTGSHQRHDSPTICQVHEGRIYSSSSNRHTLGGTHTASSSSFPSSTAWYRIIDVSTGYGLGGTTLINAGLVLPPSLEMDFGRTNSSCSSRTDTVVVQQWPDTIASQIAHSLSTITNMMYTQQCIHPSCDDEIVPVVSASSSSSTAKGDSLLRKPNLVETTTTTTFPSSCRHVPCAVTKTTTSSNQDQAHSEQPLQRVSYYESLVEPLLPLPQRKLQGSSHITQTASATANRFDITILTGYTVERLLVKHDTENDIGSSSSCTGVEVYHTATGEFHTFSATKDVILCTGTIISPVLLLNAGIGRTSHPTHRTSDSSTTTNTTQHRASDQAAVGCKLQDHVLLPRVLLTRPDFTKNALNGVRAVTNLLLHNNNNNINENHKNSSQNTKHITSTNVTTKTQINLMDSAAYLDLIPIMGAAPFRYQLRLSTDSEKEIGKLFTFFIKMVNIVLYLQYHAIQLLLHLLIHYTPIYYVSRYCIKVVAIFVMNGESYGTLTVSPISEATATTGIRRIRDVNIHIDLGYLSHPNDLQRFRQAFAASIDVYKNHSTFQTICEVFPGPLIWSYTNKTTKKEVAAPSFHTERFDFMARSMVLPYFHWIGTCAMKTKKKSSTAKKDCLESKGNEEENDDDDDWVVDENFRVRGVSNLRICDASIFPSLISAPTALTCAALGYILANMIVDEIVKEDASKMKKRE